jgi:NADPH:quinone reductase-like Zn-dependent oxidoreductase
MRLLNHGGAFVGVGAAAIQHGKGGTFRALARLARIRMASSRKDDRTVAIFIAKLRKEDLEFLGDLVATGRVKPVIERTFDLAHAGVALARINEGHLQGKLAITVD